MKKGFLLSLNRTDNKQLLDIGHFFLNTLQHLPGINKGEARLKQNRKVLVHNPMTPKWICSRCCSLPHLQMRFSNCLLYTFAWISQRHLVAHTSKTKLTASCGLCSQLQLMASLFTQSPKLVTSTSLILSSHSLYLIKCQIFLENSLG